MYTGVGSAVDLVSPELRSYVAKKVRDEVEVDNMRNRSRTLAQSQVADALDAGGLPKAAPAHAKQPKGKGKGKEAAAAGHQG